MIRACPRASLGSSLSSRLFDGSARGTASRPPSPSGPTCSKSATKRSTQSTRADPEALADELGRSPLPDPLSLAHRRGARLVQRADRGRPDPRKMTERHPHVFGGRPRRSAEVRQGGLGETQAPRRRRAEVRSAASGRAPGARDGLPADAPRGGSRIRLGTGRRRRGENRGGARRVAGRLGPATGRRNRTRSATCCFRWSTSRAAGTSTPRARSASPSAVPSPLRAGRAAAPRVGEGSRRRGMAELDRFWEEAKREVEASKC